MLSQADAHGRPGTELQRSATPPVIDVAAKPLPGRLDDLLLVHKEPDAGLGAAGDPASILALPADASAR